MRRRVTALTVEEIDPLWSTGRKLFKSGLEIYTHVIRADDDPEEKPRGKDGRTTTSWKELKKIPVWKWTSLIASHLADGVPRHGALAACRGGGHRALARGPHPLPDRPVAR